MQSTTTGKDYPDVLRQAQEDKQERGRSSAERIAR